MFILNFVEYVFLKMKIIREFYKAPYYHKGSIFREMEELRNGSFSFFVLVVVYDSSMACKELSSKYDWNNS